MTSFGKHLHRLAAGAVLTGVTFAAGAGIAAAQWYNGPPPPPPRYEAHPMRHGYAWEGGHWYRAGGRWVWARGSYVSVRPGRHWIAGRWRYGPQGRYWVAGHWS